MKNNYTRKHSLYSLFLLALSVLFFNVNAQVITTDPGVPVETQAVTIYFHSDRVSGALENYTDDIYTHTGVILKGKEGWQNVIGSWGDNDTQPKLTYLGNYTYELKITPDIRTFYSVGATDTVIKIAFVFRSANAKKQTADLFVDVFPEGLNVSILTPDELSIILEPGDTLHMEASSTLADSTALFIDGSRITATDQSNLTVDYKVSTTGGHRAVFTAYGNDSTAADSFYFYVRPPVPVAELPAGIQDGINYLSDTSVILSLYAPNKQYVFLIGDFNDWQPCDSGYLNRTPDGSRYWIRIDHLTPRQEYAYQYLVDGTLRIGDPYADKVLDPWNDPWIPIWVYPGLKPYPKDKTQGIVTVLQTAQESYVWKHTDFTPPAKEDLVVYELLVRDFTARHTFRSLIDTLGYLVRLGVNAIELMPFNEFEGNESWGYNPDYYFAPDKYYGPKNDLKAFIDSCHARGIAVIQDIVLNHAMGQCPLVQLYFDPDAGQWGQPTPENPWFNVTSPNPTYSWGYDFNHESPATKKFVTRVTRYWIHEYHIDGYRFDFTKGFTNTPGDGWNYDASRISILQGYADSIRKAKDDAILILEHFTENSEEKVLASYGLLLWGNLNCQYGQASMGYATGPCGTWDFSGISWKNRDWTTPGLVGYMESHDEERNMYKNITYGNASGDYNIKDLAVALKRIELDAVLFFTVPGPKMIWQFGELGYDYSIEYNGRTGNKPIRWDYYNDPHRRRLYEVFKALIRLKEQEPAFRSNNFEIVADKAVKTLTIRSADMNVLAVGNFDVTEKTTSVTFPAAGKWYEFFSGDSLSLSGTNAEISFAPGEYRLYTTKKLNTPDIPSAVLFTKTSGQGFTIRPNPVAGGTVHISLGPAFSGEITVDLTSLQGQTMLSRQYAVSPGKDELELTVTERIPPGIYLLTVRSATTVRTKKIVFY